MSYGFEIKPNEFVFSTRTIQRDQKFSDYILDKRKRAQESTGKSSISLRELGQKVGIRYEYFRKIVNEQKPTKKRDVILAICIALRLNSTETNEALRLYQNMPPLNPDYARDGLIMRILDEQRFDRLGQVDEFLIKNGYFPLDTINESDYRPANSVRQNIENVQIQTTAGSSIFHRTEDELYFRYRPSNYRVIAKMQLYRYSCIVDLFNGRFLIKPKGDRTSCKEYTGSGHNKNDIPRKYQPASYFDIQFAGLESLAKLEYQKVAGMLNDTKSFMSRSSASMINDRLHIYAEIFSYSVPEINEYYFAEIFENQVAFYVFKESFFMRRYLTEEEYCALYGRKNICPIEMFSSLEEITDHDNSTFEKELQEYRKKCFRHLIKKITELQGRLQNKQVFIRHLNGRFKEKKLSIFKQYQVEDIFLNVQSSENDASYEESVMYSFEGTEIEITKADLERAYELGFESFDQIVRVKRDRGNVENVFPTIPTEYIQNKQTK